MANPSRKDRSRDQILDAALVEFTETGVDGASMEALARRAGLTRATIYNLFTSKEDIAAAIGRRAFAPWEALARRQMLENDDALELLAGILTGHARWSDENRNIAIALLTQLPKVDSRPQPPDDPGSFRRLVYDLLALGQQQGSIRPDKPALILTFVVLGLHIQSLLYLLATNTPITAEQTANLLRLTLEGIGTRTLPDDGAPQLSQLSPGP
jgi:AcrR family transcriptional regulator